MRRWHRPTLISALLTLLGFLTLTLVLGGHHATAVPMVGQVTTQPPVSTPGSSVSPSSAPVTVAPTVPRSTATTRPITSTRVPTATAPARVVPTAPYTTTYRYQNQAPTTVPPTTPATQAPTTTILGIGGHLPVAPVTLPLHTTGSNGHVNPTFAWLSVAGFALALIIIVSRLYLTRPRGKDRAPIT